VTLQTDVHARKQLLLERLQEDLGTDQLDEIERLIARLIGL
jgi:hypothetical protein